MPHTTFLQNEVAVSPGPCYLQGLHTLPVPWLVVQDSHLTFGKLFDGMPAWDFIRNWYAPEKDYQFLTIWPYVIHTDTDINYVAHLWRIKLPSELTTSMEGAYLANPPGKLWGSINLLVIKGNSIYVRRAWYENEMSEETVEIQKLNIDTLCVEASLPVTGNGYHSAWMYKDHKTGALYVQLHSSSGDSSNYAISDDLVLGAAASNEQMRRTTMYQYDEALNATVHVSYGSDDPGALFDADTGIQIGSITIPPWVRGSNAHNTFIVPSHGTVGGFTPPALWFTEIATDGVITNYDTYNAAVAFYDRDPVARTYTFASFMTLGDAEYAYGWYHNFSLHCLFVTADYRYSGNTAEATADASLRCTKAIIQLLHSHPTSNSPGDLLVIGELDLVNRTFAKVYKKHHVVGIDFFPGISCFIPTRHANNMMVFQAEPSSAAGSWGYTNTMRMIKYQTLLNDSEAL